MKILEENRWVPLKPVKKDFLNTSKNSQQKKRFMNSPR